MMNENDFNFTLSGIQETLGDDFSDRTFDDLEDGKYPFRIIETTVKENSKGTGTLLTLKLEVVDHPRAGKYHWLNLNIKHQNTTAEKIALKDLASIMSACNVTALSHPSDLEDNEFVGTLKRKGEYLNMVAFAPHSQAAAAPPKVPAPQVMGDVPKATNSQPWTV